MDQAKTTEGNRLIAEFMGWTPEPGTECWIDPPYNSPPKLGTIPQMRPLSFMPFHSSWEWLMPVLEKIESNEGMFTLIEGQHAESLHWCTIDHVGWTEKQKIYYQSTSKIEAVYLAIVHFIIRHKTENIIKEAMV